MMTVKMSSKVKLNNRGASLIEILVVVAILAVLIGGAFMSFNVLNTSNIKQATRSTKTLLEKTRTKSMSVMADEWYFQISKSNGVYVNEMHKVLTDAEGNTTNTVLESESMTAKAVVSLVSGSTTVELGDSDVLTIKFNPSSGSVSQVDVNGTKYEPADNMITLYYTVGSKENWLDLYFVSGNVEVR